MKTNENIQTAHSRAQKINLQKVTDNPDFAPDPCQLFPDDLYPRAKKTLARILYQNSRLAQQMSINKLVDNMVCGCIPSSRRGEPCNAITCLAYGVTRSGEKRTVSLFDDERGATYIYVAVNGVLCLAHFVDFTPDPRYYAID